MKPKPILTAVAEPAVVLVAAGLSLACGWLAYSEYRFARGTSDIRVMWWSFVVGAVFVAAAVGGLVSLCQFIGSLLRKGTASGWDDLPPLGLAVLGALGAAAVVCCYLALGADAASRHTQLGGVEPGKSTIIWVDQGGSIVAVDPGHRGSASTGMLAYWFPALTGALSACFTWCVSGLVRRADPGRSGINRGRCLGLARESVLTNIQTYPSLRGLRGA
jgi:hypothetical protein